MPLNDKYASFFLISLAIITGLAYFIIQIKTIPEPNFIRYNLSYGIRKGSSISEDYFKKGIATSTSDFLKASNFK